MGSPPRGDQSSSSATKGGRRKPPAVTPWVAHLPSGIAYSRAATPDAAARRLSPDRRRRLPEEYLRGFGTVGRLGLEFFGAGVSALGRGARLDGLEPALQMGEILELLALPLIGNDPGIARHIGDRIGAGDEVAVGEALVEHAIEAVRLLDVAVDRVGQLFRRILAEMMVLPGHRPEPAHLPEQPLQHVEAAAQILGQELARLLCEIDEDGARFEDAHRRAAAGRIVVDDRRYAIVRRDLEEVRLELVALADIDAVDLVGKPGLLEKQGDLVPVRRRPVIEMDHVSASVMRVGIDRLSQL